MSTQAGMHGDFIEDSMRTLRSDTLGDLARVAQAASIAEHADRLVVQVVRQAHEAGGTWGQIAAVLGTSAAHARQRSAQAEQSAPGRGAPLAPSGHLTSADLEVSP